MALPEIESCVNSPVAGQRVAKVSACINCSGEIPAHIVRRTKGTAKYCDVACGNEYKRKQYAGQNTIWDIASGTVGAINELRVSVDLLVKGYSVFRALSPSCPCDLVVLCDSRVFRIEVTTGHRSVNGKIQYPRKDCARYDVLAVVLPDAIVYLTEIAELKHLAEQTNPCKMDGYVLRRAKAMIDEVGIIEFHELVDRA